LLNLGSPQKWNYGLGENTDEPGSSATTNTNVVVGFR